MFFSWSNMLSSSFISIVRLDYPLGSHTAIPSRFLIVGFALRSSSVFVFGVCTFTPSTSSWTVVPSFSGCQATPSSPFKIPFLFTVSPHFHKPSFLLLPVPPLITYLCFCHSLTSFTRHPSFTIPKKLSSNIISVLLLHLIVIIFSDTKINILH